MCNGGHASKERRSNMENREPTIIAEILLIVVLMLGFVFVPETRLEAAVNPEAVTHWVRL